MKTFVGRRYRNTALLLIACIASFFLYSALENNLHSTSFITGWLLLTISFFLMFYNIRKKIPSVPLLSSSTWLQMHIYIGIFSGFAFLLHIQFRIPNGVFEIILASVFSVVFVSGLFGLYITRTLPKKLRKSGENVIFERIPAIRKKIKESVESLVVNSIEKTDSNTLSEFYREHLIGFFSEKFCAWKNIKSEDGYVETLRIKASALEQYLNEDERSILDEIVDHIESKHEIDYQYTRQSMLKYWLFIHIPFTYSMIIFMLFHLVLTYAYHGGVS